jgi:CRISPR-associated exonuclease Cas4
MIFFTLVLLILLILLAIYLINSLGKIGILKNERIYQDSQKYPGETIYSKSLPLCGKPDYLIRENGRVIPVEVKTGRTPSSPYLNHTMQLMAYCFLVEENFGKAPTEGYLKYPEKEFKIAYTKEAREAIKDIVEEIKGLKISGKELHCEHREHN